MYQQSYITCWTSGGFGSCSRSTSSTCPWTAIGRPASYRGEVGDDVANELDELDENNELDERHEQKEEYICKSKLELSIATNAFRMDHRMNLGIMSKLYTICGLDMATSMISDSSNLNGKILYGSYVKRNVSYGKTSADFKGKISSSSSRKISDGSNKIAVMQI